MKALNDAAPSLSVGGRAAYVMLMMWPADPNDDGEGDGPYSPPAWATVEDDLEPIVRSFASALRIQGRTAYVATAAGSWHAAGAYDQAAVLSSLALSRRAGAPDSLMVNLNFVANYVARGGGGYGAGATSAAEGLALSAYDVASESAAADVEFGMVAGGTPLYATRLATALPPPPPFTVGWGAVQPAAAAAPRPLPILFEATGEGEVGVTLALSFVPAEPLPRPVYRGIEVRKTARRYDSSAAAATGKALAAAQLGKVLTVSIQIFTPDDLTDVLVEDWLPAGLEALDPLAGGDLDGDGGGGGGGWWWRCWWRCTSFTRETKKDRVTWYAPFIRAGTHDLTFEAIAATRGTFVLPPARAVAVMQPELMGLSAAGAFVVVDGSDEAAALAAQADADAAAAASAPQLSCPSDCLGRGECDTTTGICLCDPASGGDDCGSPRVAPVLEGAGSVARLSLVRLGKGVPDVQRRRGAAGVRLCSLARRVDAPARPADGGRRRRRHRASACARAGSVRRGRRRCC